MDYLICSLTCSETSSATANTDLYKVSPCWFRWTCVSLLLKDLTDSDPEPSTIERLGSGPGSGFKWESSVGEPPPPLPPLSHQACLALLFFYLTSTFGFNHQQLQTFPFWPVWCSLLATETLFGVCCWDGHQLCTWRLSSLVWFSRCSTCCFLWASQK